VKDVEMTIRGPRTFRRGGALAGARALALAAALGAPTTVPAQALPVLDIRATAPGPTVALVAGVHGGKRAAVAALQQLASELPRELRRGRVLLLAPANAAGFAAGLSQVSPEDSLNLNRVFPGRADGRPTERLAAQILGEIVAQSDYLVDLHGSDGDEAVGRFAYAARPGVDASVDSAARALAVAWGSPVIVWDRDGPRTLATSRFLQTAAHLSGVPAITVFEAGRSRDDAAATAAFVRGARALLADLGLLARTGEAGADGNAAAPLVLPRRDVTLAAAGGRWQPLVQPGQSVAPGEPLGTLEGSSGSTATVRAAVAGLVLHQRLAGPVAADTPLIILGVLPTP
jgi:predicted deacylase